jgi:RpiB/LacA/LacB family sugar-phosphate isomerase
VTLSGGHQLKIYIGADHRGFPLKRKIVTLLGRRGYAVKDMGTFAEAQSCDYPQVARKVAGAVARTKNSRGILVCMSGIGQAIAANKVHGAYAALCYNAEAAALSRRHNNANILVLGAKFVKEKDVPKILDAWFGAEFEGGRHGRRFKQIQKIEKK